ncbi:hypothetical protein CapIbe_012327 [Capra ibex]
MEPVTPGCLCNTQQLGPRVCISFTSKAPPNPNEWVRFWEEGTDLLSRAGCPSDERSPWFLHQTLSPDDQRMVFLRRRRQESIPLCRE